MPCLQGYVKTTYSQLVEKLGEPTYKREGTYSNPTEDDGDGKTSAEFGEAFEDSFYVYDYKEEQTPMKEHWWHIGGETQQSLTDFEKATGLKAHSHINFYPYRDNV